MDMLSLLERHAFTQWLESKDEDEVIGRTLDANNCPVANYLKFKGCGRHVVVGGDSAYIRMDAGLPIPTWTAHLVSGMDRINTTGSSITASQLKQILAEIG